MAVIALHEAALRPPPRRPAVFLDKDGTLVENVPYNVDPRALRFTAHALAGLQMLARAGYALVVVTNQPGLASGRFTRAEFATLQRALMHKVREQADIELLDLYACPHAAPAAGGWSPPDASHRPARDTQGPGVTVPGERPGGALRAACLCRKPAAGLLRQAALAHRLDLTRSWMIGDILDDVEAGRRAGCRTVLLDVGNETEWRCSPLRTPHHRASNLLEAARHIEASPIAEDAPASVHQLPVRARAAASTPLR